MKPSGSKDLKFVKHDANFNDNMDLPFRIMGHKLRWVAARASEDKFTRPWKILRKSDLTSEIIRELESRSVNIFRDGDTIRFGENVLAYATDEAVAVAKRRVDQETNAQRASIGVASGQRPGISISQKDTSVERVGSGDFNE
jgi:hypothetical protein